MLNIFEICVCVRVCILNIFNFQMNIKTAYAYYLMYSSKKSKTEEKKRLVNCCTKFFVNPFFRIAAWIASFESP